MNYVLVTWPESQLLMNRFWFSECVLLNDETHLDAYGSSAYFVPVLRYKELVERYRVFTFTYAYQHKRLISDIIAQTKEQAMDYFNAAMLPELGIQIIQITENEL